MSARVPLDPTAAALLAEIAADPRSCLLRVPRRTADGELRSPGAPLRATSTYLTRAERELLSVHRCEVAHLLRNAYVSKLYSEADPTSGLVRRVTRRVCIEPRDPREWTEIASASLADFSSAQRGSDEFALAAQCVADGGWTNVTVEQLVAAAQRLEPRDHGRVYAGLALLHSDSPELAARVLREVVELANDRTVLACALSGAGAALDLLGRPDQALELNLRATETAPEFVTAKLNVVVFSVLADRLREADRVRHWIDDNVSPQDESIAAIRASQLATWWPDGVQCTAPRDVRARAQSLWQGSGLAVKGVLHALA